MIAGLPSTEHAMLRIVYETVRTSVGRVSAALLRSVMARTRSTEATVAFDSDLDVGFGGEAAEAEADRLEGGLVGPAHG